jgi:hypothetical protein
MQPDAGGEHVSPGLPSVTSTGTVELPEIEVHGRWSYRLGAEVSDGIRHRLRERPAAMIIDLGDLVDPDGASLPLWLATRRACAVVRPAVGLALCLPNTTMLDHRLRRIGAQRLPRFTTMPEARTAMTNARRDANA